MPLQCDIILSVIKFAENSSPSLPTELEEDCGEEVRSLRCPSLRLSPLVPRGEREVGEIPRRNPKT